MDISAILDSIRPGAEWAMLGSADDYSALDWRDGVQTKPTEQELIDAWPAVETAIQAEQAREAERPNKISAVNAADIAAIKAGATSSGQTPLSSHVEALAQVVADLCEALGFTPTVE